MKPTILTSEGFAILLMLVAAGLIGFYSYIYYRETRQVRRLTRRQMLTLWGLRGLAAALAVMAMARPALSLIITEERAPVVGVLFDVSQSMAYDEAFEHPLADGPRSTRYETAKRALDVLLQPQERSEYGGLARSHDVHLFTFSHELRDLRMLQSRGGKADSAPRAGEMLPTLEDASLGDFTKITDAGLAAVTRLGNEKISSLIVMGDGRQTSGRPMSELVRRLTGSGVQVPVHTLVFGSEHPPRDLAIESVDCPTEASHGDVLVFQVTISNQIQDAPLDVPLTLFEASAADYESAADEKAFEKIFKQVAQRKLRLTRGRHTINVACIPDVEGKRVFRLVLPQIQDEVNVVNNSYVVSVTVVRRQINVLLIACEPNREYLYMVPALMRDPVINLSCYLQSADVDYIHQGNTTIERPPQSEREWKQYHVAILLDVDPNRQGMTVQQVVGLEDMVAKGGGLLVVGGRSQGLAKMVQVHPARIQQLLPVEIDRHAHPDHDKVFDRPFGVARSRLGREHPAMRISGDESINNAIWDTFPKFYWRHPVRQAKPRVSVLLEGEDGQPLMAEHRYQEGSVMYIGLDALWLWRYPYESFDYDRFWTRAVRYLGESKLTGAQQQVALTTDQRLYAPGERVKVNLRILNPSLRNQLGDQTLRAEVVNPNKVIDPVSLRAASESNVFTGYYHALRPGSMTVQVKHTGTDSAKTVLFEATHRFEVRHESLEAKNPTADLEAMRMLANETGGIYMDYSNMTEARLRELASQLSTAPKVTSWSEKRDVWDGFTFLLIFLVLVSTEWSMRKWWGLL